MEHWMIIARYALNGLGVYMMSRGLIDQGQVDAVTGAVLTLGTVGYAVWKRWNTKSVPADATVVQGIDKRDALKLSVLFVAVTASGPLFGILEARAADMPPVKAPRLAVLAPACTAMSCSGFYVGGNLTGIVENLAVVSQGASNSIFSGGGILSGHVGYQSWEGAFFWAIEGSVGYQRPPNGQTFQLDSDRIVGMQLVKVGYSLSGLFGGRQTPAPVTPSQLPGAQLSVPQRITEAMMAPYIITGMIERGRDVQSVTGVGTAFVLSANSGLTIDYLYGPAMNDNKPVQMFRLGFNYYFD
jgi:hypothetical protein